MNCKPFFIGISGESGVGKSTIASIISLYLGENTLRLSTDDLHKWERTSPQWNKITHLNPEANNLELGDFQLYDLSLGRPIYRSVYNHTTGVFDPPARMEPKKYVINEGLHAFYSEAMEKLIDLKIFVDTDEDLRVHWKLIRDTEQRGYKYNSVIDAINKRKIDSIPVRDKQINSADVIIKLRTAEKIKFIGYKTEDIILTVDIEFKNEAAKLNPIFGFIQKFMLDISSFSKIANIIGNNLELCQNNGGNISVKVSDSIMIIKASGYELKNIHNLNGHSIVNHKSICNSFANKVIIDDRSLERFVNHNATKKEYKRPSMESGFHSFLDKYVVHTHPVCLNVILCLQNAETILKEIYSDFMFIPYENPGFDVCKSIIDGEHDAGIYFLANHGLIVSTSSYDEALEKSVIINDIAKLYIMKNNHNFKEFSIEFANIEPAKDGFFYPDSAVFLDNEKIEKKEILAAHNYIYEMAKPLGNLQFLSKENVYFLQNLESEIYRKSL